MNEAHRQNITSIYYLLIRTETLSKDTAITGTFSGGETRCISQFNRMLDQLVVFNAVTEGFFDPLPEDAPFGEIGVACSHLATYLVHTYPDWFKDAQLPTGKVEAWKAFGEKVRERMPDVVVPDFVKDRPKHYTKELLNVLKEAPEEAKRLENNYVAPEHLALAVLRHHTSQEDFPADINLAAISQALEANKGHKRDNMPDDRLDYTPQAKELLESATHESDRMNKKQTDIEHLMLAVVRSPLRQIFEENGVTYERIRNKLEEQKKNKPTGNKFSDRFKMAMQYAREEAARLQHDYIATEHLLLAITRDESCSGAMILKKLEIDLDELRQIIEEATVSQSGAIGQVPFTPRAKQALEIATHEANSMKAKIIGTQHLLIALVRDKQGIASQILATYGINYNKVSGQMGK